MDINKIITITGEAVVDGENKIYTFYFYPYRQYVFVDSEIRFRDIEEKGGMLDLTGQEKTHVLHYKIVADDGKDYCWLSSDYCVVEGKLRTPEQQQLKYKIEKQVVDQPKDYKKLYYELTGQEIKKYISRNGNATYLDWLRHKGKTGKYGVTIKEKNTYYEDINFVETTEDKDED